MPGDRKKCLAIFGRKLFFLVKESFLLYKGKNYLVQRMLYIKSNLPSIWKATIIVSVIKIIIREMGTNL